MNLRKIVLLVSLLGCIEARTYYMDSPTACGQKISVADESIIVSPRSPVGVGNPPLSCIMYFESSYSSSNYRFEIVFERFRFPDCGMTLKVFDGLSIGGAYIKELGCSSKATTGYLYSKDRAVTIQLVRPVEGYRLGNDFLLRISVFRDASAPDDFVGTDQFPVGAIIGIVLGIIVLVAFAILLGWCYKTGRLSGLGGDDLPSGAIAVEKAYSPSHSASGTENNGFRSWHNMEKMSIVSDSRSNFNLDNDQIMNSLLNVSSTTKNGNSNMRNNNSNNNKGGRGVNQGRYEKNIDRSDSNGVRVERTASISRTPGSSSPGPRPRSRRVEPPKAPSLPNLEGNKKVTSADFDRGELGLRGSDRSMRRRGSTGDVEKEISEKRRTQSGVFENPDSEGYMYDYDQVKKLSGDVEPPVTKTQDFATELQEAIKRNSMKRMNSLSQSDSNVTDPPGAPETSVKAINDADSSSSSGNLNTHTDGEATGPEAHSSPKPSKKKHKGSREKRSPKSSRKNENERSPKLKSKQDKDDGVPPEIYAPIFSDENDNQDYVSNQYQPGYQTGYPMHYDPRYPMGQYPAPGVPPMYPGMPFQQAGQAQWYVENTPTGQQKMAFAMTTHSQGSQDDSRTGNYGNRLGRPNYQSTPYYNNHYGAPQGYNSRSNNPTNALVPAGTILDDPQVPPPGMTVARYDDDPVTGVKTSQVIWTDSKPDPTDPLPGSEGPQITRKTITRITTKTNKDDLPDAPDPHLQDLSFRTAQQIQATGQEPAFMSPSKGAQSSYYPYNAIQYANQTPERSNAGFYTGMNRQPDHIPGSPVPVIHKAPSASSAFKDRITLNDSEVLYGRNRARASDGQAQELDKLLPTE